MRYHIAVGLLLSATAVPPIWAQDFELDLEFDDSSLTFDEEVVFDESIDEADANTNGDFAENAEIAFSPAREGNLPDFRLVATTSSTTTPGFPTSSASSLSLIASDDMALGELGFLEWQVSAIGDLDGGGDVSFNIDKLILQNSFGNISVKVGKFPIGWGEIEGMPVLDVLNSTRSINDLGTATEDLAGQWFATFDYFDGGLTTSAFIGLDPHVSHGAATELESGGYEFGSRLSIPFEGGAANLYAARLMPQSGVVNATGTTSSATAYTLVGASAHKAFDALLVEFDVAVKLGLERATATGYTTRDRVDAAIGVEYALSNSTQLTASFATQHWLDGGSGFFDYGPGGAQASPQTTGSYQLSASRSFGNGNFTLTGFAGGAADGSAGFAALQAGWTPNDRFDLSASFSTISASPGSLLAPLDGTQSISVTAGYYF